VRGRRVEGDRKKRAAYKYVSVEDITRGGRSQRVVVVVVVVVARLGRARKSDAKGQQKGERAKGACYEFVSRDVV